MIGTLPPESKRNWQAQVATLVHGYNCTKSSATGFKPYTLMFGREPLLPIDVEFGVRTPDVANVATHKYIQRLQNRMEWAFKTAAEQSAKESARHKRYYDRKVRCSRLEPGDLVLVRQKAFRGKHKIQDKWENLPYKVVEQVDSKLPVFKVESTGDLVRTRVLHRNMLFPLLTHALDPVQPEEKVVPAEVQSSEGDVPEVTDIDSTDEESDSLDLAEEQSYKGPMTRSRTKCTSAPTINVVAKANKLMEQHFGMAQEVPEQDFDPDYPDLFAHIEAGFTSIRQWWTNR